MQVSFQRIEDLNLDISKSHSLVIVSNFELAKSISGGSNKSLYRKFMAESNHQLLGFAQESLTDQFKAGTLQQAVNSKKIDPNTLIHQAILENNPEVIRFLLDHGVDVDYPDEHGMSPLTIAILNRCNYAVQILLKSEANSNPKVKWNDMSLLELALLLDDKITTNFLIDAGADVNCTLHGNWKDYSPLTVALIIKKDMDLARHLINLGANLNEKEGEKSPLYIAVICDLPLEFKKFLIEKGADVNGKYIWQSGNPGKKLEPRPLLLEVFQKKDIELAKCFINAGANINETDYLSGSIHGKFPIEFIKLLIEEGADVNGSPGWPGCPLHCAISAKDIELMKFLINRGADVNNCYPNGYIPLISAINTGDLNLVKCIIEFGADVNQKISRDGVIISPIKCALGKQHPEIVQYLLQHGAKA